MLHQASWSMKQHTGTRRPEEPCVWWPQKKMGVQTIVRGKWEEKFNSKVLENRLGACEKESCGNPESVQVMRRGADPKCHQGTKVHEEDHRKPLKEG